MGLPRFPALLLAAAVLVACASPEERAARFLARAQELQAAGDTKAAMVEARNAVQVEPKNAEARYLMALLFEAEGNLPETISNLQIAVDANPAHLAAQLKLGTLYFYGKAWAQAEAAAAAAAKVAPGDPEVRLLQARLALQRGDEATGLGLIDAVLAADAAQLDAVTLKAMTIAPRQPAEAIALLDATIAAVGPQKTEALRRVRLGLLDARRQVPEIENTLKGLSADFPANGDYPLQLAELYRGQGRVDAAEKVMRDFLARRPGDVPARLGFVQFLAQARGPEVAEAELKALLAREPKVSHYRQALGRRYEATGRRAEALAIYRGLAEDDPKSEIGLAARRELAKAAFADGRADEGARLVDAILADVPEDPDALVLRAGRRFDARQFEEAIADLRTALRRRPDLQVAQLLLARTYLASGDATLAVETYRRLLDQNPGQPEAVAELAPLLAARGDREGAVRLLQQQVDARPDDLQALGRLAEIQLAQGNLEAAEATARRMQGIKGQDGLGDFELGRVLDARKQYGAAAEAFRAALRARPADVTALNGLVDTLLAANQAEAARRAVEGFRAANPGDVRAGYLLGLVHAREGRAAEARPLFEAAIRAQPGVPVYYLALAGLEQKPEGRAAVLKRGLAALPGDAQLGLRLAEAEEQAGRFDEAIAVYESFVGKPGAPPVMANNLAALLLDHRTDAKSIARALELAQAFATSGEGLFLDTLGWAHYRSGDYASAVRTLERAAAAAPGQAQIRSHLAEARKALAAGG